MSLALSGVAATEVLPAPGVVAWPATGRIAFRFFAALFVFGNLPWPLGDIPKTAWASTSWNDVQQKIVLWAAERVLHFQDVKAVDNGSGDRSYDFAYWFVLVLLSLAISAIWSVLDARRSDYERLHVWVRTYVRYVLCATMLSYGSIKLVRGQFPALSGARLIESLGDLTPMGMLWTFMGASSSYTFFAGLMEVVGGALLLFRRTTLLGALLLCGVIGNVVILNFCYDVPVKLYSLSLLLMALFLVAPDGKRLADFFLRNRATAPDDPQRLFQRRSLRWGAAIAKLLLIGVLVNSAVGNVTGVRKAIAVGATAGFSGVYDVEQFERDGKQLETGDPARWRRVGIGDFEFGIKRGDDSFERLRLTVSPDGRSLTLAKRSEAPKTWPLQVVREPGSLLLTGRFADSDLRVRLRRIDPGKINLTSMGFRWINEFPDNR
jgi:hypothetical protein